jgi:hypothetical protein
MKVDTILRELRRKEPRQRTCPVLQEQCIASSKHVQKKTKKAGISRKGLVQEDSTEEWKEERGEDRL